MKLAKNFVTVIDYFGRRGESSFYLYIKQLNKESGLTQYPIFFGYQCTNVA